MHPKISILCAALFLAFSLRAASPIPEPGLIMYGTVRNTAAGNIRQTYGTLLWTFQKPGGGTVTVTSLLTNLNDQFSYVITVPFESVMPGLTTSTNALALSATPVVYLRSSTIDGTPVTFSNLSQTNFTFSVIDRARIEQVDLNVSYSPIDTDHDDIPDAWLSACFGHPTGQSYDLSRASDDADGDGLSNLAEFKAGTNPRDPQSCFEFINVAHNTSGVEIRWSSQPDKHYALDRSLTVVNGYAPIATNIAATPHTNIFQDLSATNSGPYFYRVRLQE
jgi:hypothetical protein